MVVKVNYKDQKLSTYICDRCHKKVTSEDKVGIYIKKFEDFSSHKEWDLCSSCYEKLFESMKKHQKGE